MFVATSLGGKVKTVLAGGLLLFGATACANRDWSDWAKVQALAVETRTEVQLHKEVVPQGNRKVKGRLHAVTDDSITLQLKDGQQRTLRKQEVHRVGIRKPISKWKLILGTLARTTGYIGGCYIWGDGPSGELLLIVIPAATGVEIWSQMQMWKVYEAGPSAKSPTGNRHAGTRNP